MAAVRRAQLIRGLGSAVPDKRSHADPATVREVEYALARSAAVYRLITTITDPAQAPAEGRGVTAVARRHGNTPITGQTGRTGHRPAKPLHTGSVAITKYGRDPQKSDSGDYP
jgi:hypothetical protein